jgi:hypothetical protein
MSEKARMTPEERKRFRRLSQKLYSENNPKYDAGQKVNNLKRKVKKLREKALITRNLKKKELEKKLLVAEDESKEFYERLIESMNVDTLLEIEYITIVKLALNKLNNYALINLEENITQETIFKGIYSELAAIIMTNQYIPNEHLAIAFYNLVFQDSQQTFPMLESINQQAVARLIHDCKKNLELANDIRAMLYDYMNRSSLFHRAL